MPHSEAMILAEAIADIAGRLTSVAGLPCRVAQTGEPYVEIVSGGEVALGERAPCLCTSEAAAVRLWHEAVIAHWRRAESAASVSGADACWTLYWRIEPEIVSRVVYEEDSATRGVPHPHYSPVTFWAVYSRLLISAAPVRYPDMAAFAAAA